MDMIGRLKRKSGSFRHIIESLMHPYPMRSGNIGFLTVTDH